MGILRLIYICIVVFLFKIAIEFEARVTWTLHVTSLRNFLLYLFNHHSNFFSLTIEKKYLKI